MYAKNIWENMTADKKDAIFAFAEDYKQYLSKSKTERLAVSESEALAKTYGFKPADEYETLKEGDKVYFINRGKNIALYVVGKRPVAEGIRILGAHIDSPRLDVKQNPLYESNGFAMLDTHYYGGIKKFHYTTIPLALHGVICKKDGSVIHVNIGDKEDDPVVGISDLLIHLSADQLQKPAAKVIEGENLDVTIGSIPLEGEEKDAVKANILKYFADFYGVEEEDFLSAEIEVVPAGKARDYGLDRSMIMSYGHDDRVCAYSSLRALLDQGAAEYTTCCILVDKEEIGSVGATGAASWFFENTIAELLCKTEDTNYLSLKRALENSAMLSSDVSVDNINI